MATNMSKKRKFVADGVFYAELNEASPALLSVARILPPVDEGTVHGTTMQTCLLIAPVGLVLATISTLWFCLLSLVPASYPGACGGGIRGCGGARNASPH